jgi:hypothetical protein
MQKYRTVEGMSLRGILNYGASGARVFFFFFFLAPAENSAASRAWKKTP